MKTTPAVPCLGKLCEENGYSHELKECHSFLQQKCECFAFCKCDNFAIIVVPGLSSGAHFTSSAEDSAENIRGVDTG